MNKYSISSEALRDLDEISDYLAQFSIDAAEGFIQKFSNKCQNLARFPNMGKSYDKIIPGLKGVVLGNYIIFYQLKPEELEIVRVVSGYRNLEAVFIDNED